MSKQLYIVIIVILFLFFCASQYVIYKQNETIAGYTVTLDEWTIAYGKCIGEKWILQERIAKESGNEVTPLQSQ